MIYQDGTSTENIGEILKKAQKVGKIALQRAEVV